MPELPEVETFVRILKKGTTSQPSVVGKRITKAQVLWEGVVAKPALNEFIQRIQVQEILEVWRRAKYLCFTLTSDTLILHLGMSGDLLVEPTEAPIAKHHRMVLVLENGLRLAFNDVRKFGRVWLVGDPQEVLADLGPEPLDPAFTARDFYANLQRTRRQLKSLLLDQAFLAGIGNIYADETLHRAGLHPLVISNKLDLPQAEKLWAALRQVLREAIRHNGSSIDWAYRGGNFQDFIRVYRRTGEPCPACSTPIQRIVLGQLGTHYCPVCQPEM